MTRGCDTENNIGVKVNHIQVVKERCSISEKLTFNSNSTPKSNTECIIDLKKVRTNNINNSIIATLNIKLLFQNLLNLRLLGKEFSIF